MCVGANASSCAINSMTMSPAMPARVVVAGTPASGKVIFGSNLYIDATCTYTESSAWQILIAIPFGSTAQALTNVTGVNGQASGGTSVSQTSGGCGNGGASIEAQYSQQFVSFNPGQTCRFVVRLQLQFVGTGATPSGTMDPNTPSTASGNGGTITKWANFFSCTTGTCTQITPTGVISAFNSTFVSQANTCTVNSGYVNQTITLPTLSTAQLSGSVGKTAGQTPFSLSLACNTSGGQFGVSTLWNFTEGPAQNVIANAGSATGVGFQINDSTGTAVLNNISRQTITSGNTINGTNSINYWLYYYTTLASVGSGTASATAAWTLTYN